MCLTLSDSDSFTLKPTDDLNLNPSKTPPNSAAASKTL